MPRGRFFSGYRSSSDEDEEFYAYVKPVNPYDLLQVPVEHRKGYETYRHHGVTYRAVAPDYDNESLSDDSEEDSLDGYDSDNSQYWQIKAARGDYETESDDMYEQLHGLPRGVTVVDSDHGESSGPDESSYDDSSVVYSDIDPTEGCEVQSFNSGQMARAEGIDDRIEEMLRIPGITAAHDGIYYIEKVYRIWRHNDYIDLDIEDLDDRLRDAYEYDGANKSDMEDIKDHIIEMIGDDHREFALNLAAEFDDSTRFYNLDDEGAGDEINTERVELVIQHGATSVLEYMLNRRYKQIIDDVVQFIDDYDEADCLHCLLGWLEDDADFEYADNEDYAEGIFSNKLAELTARFPAWMQEAIQYDQTDLLQYFHAVKRVQLPPPAMANLPDYLNSAAKDGQLELVKYLHEKMNVRPTRVSLRQLKQILQGLIGGGKTEMVRYLLSKRQPLLLNIQAAHKKEAIKTNSPEMLKIVAVDASEANIRYAIKQVKIEALKYFYSLDPDLVLDKMKRTKLPDNDRAYEVLTLLWDYKHQEAEKIKLIKFVLKSRTGHARAFFGSVGLQHVFELVKGGYQKHLRNTIRDFISRLEGDEALRLTESADNQAGVDRFLFSFPGDATVPADSIVLTMRHIIATDQRLEPEAMGAASMMGVPLNNASTYFRHVMSTAYYQMPREDSETYCRGAHGVLTRRHKKDSELELPKKCPASMVDAELKKKNKKSIVGWNTGKGARVNQIQMKTRLEAGAGGKGGGAKPKKKTKIKLEKTALSNVVSDGYMHQASIIYRQRICNHMEQTFRSELGICTVGNDTGYPNMMVHFKQPPIPKNIVDGLKKSSDLDTSYEAWVNVMISFYLAIVNYMSTNQGFEIELVRRSSFGHNTPTLAHCGNAMRINVGIIPVEYADILVHALTILEEAMHHIYTSPYDWCRLSRDAIFFQQSYIDYYGEDAHKPATVYEALWTPLEKPPGKRAVYCLSKRTPYRREYLSEGLFNAIHRDPPKNAASLARLMIQGIHNCLRTRFFVNSKGNLSFRDNTVIRFQKIRRDHKLIDDGLFFVWVKEFAENVRLKLPILEEIPQEIVSIKEATIGRILRCVPQKSMTDIYALIETLNEVIMAWSIYAVFEYQLEDEVASDSDEEVVLEEYPEESLRLKKVVLHNGMRSIWLSLQAASQYLFRQPSNKKKIVPKLFSYQGYFEKETNWATWSQKAQLEKTTARKRADIIFCDLNACITDGTTPATFTVDQTEQAKILVLDRTSALPPALRKWCFKVLDESPVEVILTVGSNLKLEQGGGDRNHCGTVYVVAKNRVIHNQMMAYLNEFGTPIHSRYSHTYRRIMKKLGHAASGANFFGNTRGKRKHPKTPIRIRKGVVQRFTCQFPDGSQRTFLAGDPPADGDCGFNTLGVTRATFVQTIKARRYDGSLKTKLAHAIVNFVVSNPMGLGQEDSHLVDLIMNYFMGDSELAMNLLLEYCRQDHIQTAYLDYLEKPRVWLDYKTALIYAEIKGINLYVWSPKSRGGSVLTVQDSYQNPAAAAAVEGANTIHMFYGDSCTHFLLLFEEPELEQAHTIGMK